ncbi:hypothetical protein DFH08DRAFT_977716 [Mycena albidolilacea]|uniref:Uncharacterized protein n=1 Tax=Mycena albidolilacea TaxID=1033008 RepID=A0AAD7E8W7_9AGAR|nr:hypothetical protein DFH08DRAFT_977716 [Mycena albidolilacea]
MPPVVLEPKHMSYQALHPDPEEYVPPPEVQQEWNKVNDQVSLLMACNFPTHAKQLALFNETATIMVHHTPQSEFPLVQTFPRVQASLFPYAALIATQTPIYEAFCRFTNKFRAFWVPQGRQDHPQPVKEVLLFIEDLLKLCNRAKINKTTAERIAREKHCVEEEEALMEVQATKKGRPYLSHHSPCSIFPFKAKKNKKGKAPKEDADDGESVIADVNTPMDNVSTSQDSNNADIQSINGKVFMAEINDQEEHRANVKTKGSGKVSKASKGKAGRAETAMKIVEKTNPTEATQVAAEPNSVRCKRRRANSFVEADPDSQGPATDPPIRSAAIRAVIDQVSRLIQDSQGHLSNEALIRQEYENRSEYNVTVHRLEHHLTIAKLLYAEQERLVALMQERKVSPLAELLSVYDE